MCLLFINKGGNKRRKKQVGLSKNLNVREQRGLTAGNGLATISRNNPKLVDFEIGFYREDRGLFQIELSRKWK